MSIQHFAPGQVIDISPYGADFSSATSETLIRESHIEVFRFILIAAKPHRSIRQLVQSRYSVSKVR